MLCDDIHHPKNGVAEMSLKWLFREAAAREPHQAIVGNSPVLNRFSHFMVLLRLRPKLFGTRESSFAYKDDNKKSSTGPRQQLVLFSQFRGPACVHFDKSKHPVWFAVTHAANRRGLMALVVSTSISPNLATRTDVGFEPKPLPVLLEPGGN